MTGTRFISRLVIIAAALLLLLFQACAPASVDTPAPTRVARSLGPTKFARMIPTDAPTAMPLPTRSPTASIPPSATPTRHPPPTLAPSPRTVVNRLSSAATETPTPQDSPTPLVAANTPTAQIIGAEALGGNAPCAPIENETYDMLQVNSGPTDRPAEFQADLNLRLRSYAPVNQLKGLVDYDGPVDGTGPQLYSLFANQRTAKITGTYEVYDWNWGTDSRGGLVTYPDVTLIGLQVEPGETIYMPQANLDIGLGHKAMVLYASANRLTLKFTREDNVVDGYALHLEGMCVEPRLVALYQQANDGGRGALPALRAGQAIGRASGAGLGVAVRDRGTFMDPRSRKNWWIGR